MGLFAAHDPDLVPVLIHIGVCGHLIAPTVRYIPEAGNIDLTAAVGTSRAGSLRYRRGLGRLVDRGFLVSGRFLQISILLGNILLRVLLSALISRRGGLGLKTSTSI